MTTIPTASTGDKPLNNRPIIQPVQIQATDASLNAEIARINYRAHESHRFKRRWEAATFPRGRWSW